MTTTGTPASPLAKQISSRYLGRLRRGDLLETLMYFSLAIVLALFLADGGAIYFTDIKEVATGLGIVAGLVGTDLLLIMLILAARIPILDRTFGHDKALALHRKLGKPVLYLILGHMLLLLIGYGISSGRNIVAEAIDMIANLPDMGWAFIATGLMILVVVTSLVIVRRKLSYQFWYVVHLLSYAAVLLALPHQFTNGQLFGEGKMARWYWMALCIATFASIVIYRVILPTALSLKHKLVVTSVDVDGPGVVSITMTGQRLDELVARGGQFFNWRFWAPGLWWDSHPYSLSAHPDGRSLRITVRDLGDSSNKLLKLKPGVAVSFEGPYGLFSDAARTTTKAVFIGAGIGITPIRAMLEDVRVNPAEAVVILRGATDDQVYLWDETYDLCVKKSAHLRVLVGHRPRGIDTWLSAEAYSAGERLDTLAPDILHSDVFICGPTAWLDLVVANARDLGVPEHRIHAERFDF
jgi:predicted ferric reductase